MAGLFLVEDSPCESPTTIGEGSQEIPSIWKLPIKKLFPSLEQRTASDRVVAELHEKTLLVVSGR